MESPILDLLKKKPKPKEQQPTIIQLEKPEMPESQKKIDINVPIVDKREVTKINRSDILARIKPKTEVDIKLPDVK
mgnify:CR=1 FL=1